MSNTLALFDFDGTITRKDSFIEFIKFYKGLPSFYLGLIVLSPLLLLFKAGIIKNWTIKELVFTYYFKNEKYNNFRDHCREFGLNYIPALIKPMALEIINNHIKNNDRIVIISASFEEVLIDWCNNRHLELIGTRIEVINGSVTGKISGKNCYGTEKVNRLKQYLEISRYTDIYAYGDSKGDLPLIELSNHKFYRLL
jgi:HAD superfamily hydrolase (TIGR01490 family)